MSSVNLTFPRKSALPRVSKPTRPLSWVSANWTNAMFAPASTLYNSSRTNTATSLPPWSSTHQSDWRTFPRIFSNYGLVFSPNKIRWVLPWVDFWLNTKRRRAKRVSWMNFCSFLFFLWQSHNYRVVSSYIFVLSLFRGKTATKKRTNTLWFNSCFSAAKPHVQ